MAITIDESSDKITFSSYTSNTFLYVGTGGLLTPTTSPTNGQLLIGSTGAAPVIGSITGANGLSVTGGAGTISLSNAAATAGTVTAAGTSQGTATTLTYAYNVITGGTGGVIMPAPTWVGQPLAVENRSGSTINIYPNSGGQIETLGANIPIGVADGGCFNFMSTSSTQWYHDTIVITNGTGISISSLTTGDSAVKTITNTGVLSLSGDGTIINNSASTGAVTLTLANAASGTILGNATTSSAIPTYTSNPILGIAGSVSGSIGLANGNTGGDVVTIQSITQTASNYNFNLPATAGSSGQPLLSGGGGSSPMTFGTLGVTNGGTGTTTQFTTGSVIFAGASGVYSQDNAKIFWDDTNYRLGIGTTSPAKSIDVTSTGSIRHGSIICASSLPTVAIGTAAGTGASLGSHIGTEHCGFITLNTGTGTTTGILMTFTVPIAMPNYILAVFQAQNSNASGVMTRIVSNSTSTTFTLEVVTTALAASTAYSWNYIALGY